MDINLLRNLLVCPGCRNDLEIHNSSLNCNLCETAYPLVNGKVEFMPFQPKHNDLLDQLKTKIKKFPIIYEWLAEVVAPVYISKKTLKTIIREINSGDQLGLNIGSGITNYSENIVNFDLQSFKNVQVVGDLFKLPFKDCKFDYVFSIYVLEHVPNPELAIEEMYRVLKPGGICYSLVPFIQGFHAAPLDFLRFTPKGVESYFYKFEIIKNRGLGPTSALLWILQEWLALVLSFNSKKLHLLIHSLIMFISFPFKYLDLFL
jgi:SAM-dependent methyltransferase